MVPSMFVPLDSLPLTANGKIDRNALPHPSTLEQKSDAPPEPPQNELESAIAQAWKEALGVEQIELDKNFLDLGAHSLMVAEVHMQLQQSLGREISLVDMFQFPTVRALANHLNGQDTAAPVLNRAERRLAARQQRKQ
jgi:acyl carrier protein